MTDSRLQLLEEEGVGNGERGDGAGLRETGRSVTWLRLSSFERRGVGNGERRHCAWLRLQVPCFRIAVLLMTSSCKNFFRGGNAAASNGNVILLLLGRGQKKRTDPLLFGIRRSPEKVIVTRNWR